MFVIDGDGKIVTYNSAAREILGSQCAVGIEIGLFVSPQTVKSILTTEHYSVFTADITIKDSLQIEQTAIVLDISSHDPDSQKFLLTFKSFLCDDIEKTEREGFLATVAHDLKNPIGAIFGYADVLLDTPAGESLNEKQRDIVARIRRTASRAIELVRNYQQLSMIRQSDYQFADTQGVFRTGLNQSVNSVADYTWREDPEDPAIEYNLSSDEIYVGVDRVHVERLISNLFSNALKYTAPGGVVKISTYIEGQKGVFRIQNDSPPLSSDELRNLFMRYTRGSTSKGVSGTGLGLYIVKYITDRIGGTIQVTSSQKDGVIFSLGLPLAKKL